MVLSDDYLWYYELDYLEILIAHACAKLKVIQAGFEILEGINIFLEIFRIFF